MCFIAIKHLSYSYNGRRYSTPALADINLLIEQGEVLGLTGPSGCGKSTLLHILSGIIQNYIGTVQINGSRPNPRQHSIALVPQNFALLPWKTVEENILLPQTFGKRCPNALEQKRIVKELEIDRLLRKYPHELSGGQKQRIALARAFIQSPDLLLMDEPFSSLDIGTANKGRDFFQHFQRELGVTTVLVSHNLEEIQGLTDRVAVLTGTPGTITSDCRDLTKEELRNAIVR